MKDTPFMIMLAESEPIRLLNVLHIVTATLDDGNLALAMPSGVRYTLKGEAAATVF